MRDADRFHVITCISNPVRYQSRYKLFDIFAEDIQRLGATLWTAEMQTGSRLHKVTDKDDPHHIQVWSSAIPGELWHKENLLNIALQQLTVRCPDWKYVMWVDADVKFEPGALMEIVHALQHWDVVQCWSHAIDLGPNNETIGIPHRSFMYCYWKGIEPMDPAGYLIGGHPGFAWAARRDALNKMGTGLGGGPLIDWGILGSADRHMAAAFIGKVEQSVNTKVHPAYLKWLKLWQYRSDMALKRNVGYVTGTIRHLWHGRKAQRGYATRWQILVKHQFNPETDLTRDVTGIWRLTSESPRQLRLRDDVRKYFRSRNEDSIDTF